MATAPPPASPLPPPSPTPPPAPASRRAPPHGGVYIPAPANRRPNLAALIPARSYPTALVGHAGTPYFMALGQLLRSPSSLSARRLKAIEQSFALRRALLEELHARIIAQPTATPDERTRALADLARTQEPKLAELETGAEAIRRDLTVGRLFTTTADDPSDLSAGNLAPGIERARHAFAAAHYHEGLSLEQRALLEEIAMESWLAAPASDDTASAANPTPPDRAVFFWPAGARVRFPAPLPPALAAALTDFQSRKSALKTALAATVERARTHFSTSGRTSDYERLAAEQAPAFADLDARAEQIRRDLAALPAGPPLPHDLGRRVADVVARHAALQRELFAALRDFRAALPGERVELVQQSERLALKVSADPAATGVAKAAPAARRAVIDRIRAFSANITARFAAVAAEREAVRAALEDSRRSLAADQAHLTVDQFLDTFLEAYQARALEERQPDYYAAALLPGLSPAQHRLLLAAVRAQFLRDLIPPAAAPVAPAS